MKTIDAKLNEKHQNKQHKDYFEGLLRIVPEGSPVSEEVRPMQERHNANHALYYFSFLTHSLIEGICKNWCNPSKAERIAAHLSTLREFIGSEEMTVRQAVGSLLTNLSCAQLVDAESWAKFIVGNWSSIKTLSSTYGSDDLCFSNEKLIQLQAIISGHQYLKLWWWKYRFERICRKLTKIRRAVKKFMLSTKKVKKNGER